MTNETKTSKRPNPHKYLLYKPTFSQLFTFLSSGFKVGCDSIVTNYFVDPITIRFLYATFFLFTNNTVGISVRLVQKKKNYKYRNDFSFRSGITTERCDVNLLIS